MKRINKIFDDFFGYRIANFFKDFKNNCEMIVGSGSINDFNRISEALGRFINIEDDV